MSNVIMNDKSVSFQSNYVSKLALGTAQFGLDYGISNAEGQTPQQEIEDILGYCTNNFLTTLDTAQAYGNAEKCLGVCDLTDFNIVSKFILDDTNTKVFDLLNVSLDTLQQKSIYAYLCHRPLDALKNNCWQELSELKHTNKVTKIGFSFNTLEEAEQVLEKGLIPDLIQIPFNIFDNRFQNIATELKHKHNTEIHSRSTFLQGLFFLPQDKLDGYFQPIKHIITELQNEFDDTLATVLLNYVVQQNFIDKVVIGVNNQQQLMQNIQSLISLNTHPFHQSTLAPITVDEKYIVPSLWKK